jgi:hypothetical protein
MHFLCKYKDILGEPNKGVHSIRLFDISLVEIPETIILGMIIQYILKKCFNIDSSLWLIILILFLLGIILHRLFCVRTTIDKLLFSD